MSQDRFENMGQGRQIQIIEESGLKIVAQKRILLSNEQAQNFYSIHKDKSFYKDLVEYMTSGPVVVQLLEGKDSINIYRAIMGSTNPENAEEGTIRKKFAVSIQENSVHGSDSLENGKKEIDSL